MGFVVFALFGVGALFASSMFLQGMKRSWPVAASMLDMEIDLGLRFSGPTIRGRVDGIEVTVDTYSADNQHFTQYWISYPPSGPPVRIKRQVRFHKVSRFFGGKDVEVGDPAFDDQVVVDSAHPDQIRRFLTPSRQAAVLALLSGRHNVTELTHDTIIVATPGREVDPDTIVRMVRQLVAYAQVMGDSAEVDAALAMQQQGELGSAIEELHAINDRNPNVFTQLLEAEALIEHGEHEQARQVIAPVLEVGGPEAEGWKRVADAPAPVMLPAPAQAPAVVSGLGQQAVIDDLFGGQRMSFEIVERFEAHYVNRRVGWSGTVTQVHSYRHDNEFGEGPGLKATVLLGSSGSGSLISNEVHAVVHLGVDVPLERGRAVSFAGTLLHVDRFARKLYVSRGALT